MPDNTQLASQIKIKVKGQDLQANIMSKVLSVTVDQNVHLPAMFIIRFQDTGLELLNNNSFDLADEVEISAQKSDNSSVPLIKGEIVGLEPDYREGMVSELVVRGYDKSHRLRRNLHSVAYINVKDSDVASRIAQNAGIESEIETTQTVYKHIFQHNKSDLEFLTERANRIGFECFVMNNKLYFRKPPATSSASVKVTWGSDLLSFKPRMTLGAQVDEVVVKGWDVEKKQAIIGRSQSGNLSPQFIKQQDGSQLAKSGFGDGKLVIVNQHVVSQEDANNLASARMNEVSGRFVEAEGLALRRPDITAGQKVEIAGLADRFNGSYMVTSAVHHYSPSGFRTTFNVSGMHAGLISENLVNKDRVDRIFGFIPAIVTNTDDPMKMGRVKLKFPTLTEDHESTWARVLAIGAADKTGLCIIPSVGDEVLAGFINGSIDFPIVIGGVYGGQENLPPEVDGAGSGEFSQVRTWHSASGHWIAMYDNNKKKVEIVTAGGQSITLDDQEKKIIIKTESVTMTIEGNKMQLESGSDVSVKAGSNLKLEASGNIDIKASGQVNIKGATVNLN